jgi:hypothetical protein
MRLFKLLLNLHNQRIDHGTIQLDLRYFIWDHVVILKCRIIVGKSGASAMVEDFGVQKHVLKVRLLVESELDPNQKFELVSIAWSRGNAQITM